MALTDKEQKLIAMNLVGGFQTEGVKAKWLNECDAECPFCQAIDTHSHRMLECPFLESVRLQHPDAVKLLSRKLEWMYHPFFDAFPEEKIFFSLFQSVTEVDLQSIVPTPAETHIYFTDGSCIFPDDVNFRRAAWAVIRQTSSDEDIPSFECVLLGSTHGRQTIARSELVAVERACRLASKDPWCKVVVIYTDSQYVVDSLKNLEWIVSSPGNYKTANLDILQSIAEIWQGKLFCIRKVKSHRRREDARDEHDLFTILGNDTADKAAALAVSRFPSQLVTLVDEARTFYAKQADDLNLVWKYFVDFNTLRFRLVHEHDGRQSAMSRGENEQDFMKSAIGNDALNLMSDYSLTQVRIFDRECPEDTTFLPNLQGSGLGWLVYHWSKTLKWPVMDDVKKDTLDTQVTAFGISAFELLVNFCIVTDTYFPIRTSGSAGTSIFMSYTNEQVALLPHSKRAAGMQLRSFLACVTCIETLTGHSLFPTFKQSGFSSLRRLGINSATTGWAGRPVMLRQAETMNCVNTYIHSLDGSNAFWRPLCVPKNDPLISIPEDLQDNLTAHERYCMYLRTRKAAN